MQRVMETIMLCDPDDDVIALSSQVLGLILEKAG